MGRALFLSEGFHKRLHDGGAQFPARPCEVRRVSSGHSRRERGHRSIAQGFFCTKEGLNFKLLADPDAKVSTIYGFFGNGLQKEKNVAKYTFIINPKGEIAKLYTGVKPAEHSEQVLKDLADLKKSYEAT